MKILIYIWAFLGLSVLNAQTTLVGWGSNWLYYDAEQEPDDQGSLDWNDVNFNDTNWSNGPAQLGYGDNDEATEINNQTLTAYFRNTFNVIDSSVFGQIDFNLLYDDGAVIYLNGVEVWRVNMPSGAVNYNTFASGSSGDDAQASIQLTVPLQNGDNVLAVEVHQRSSGSSDISFDFKLSGNAPGAVNVTRGPYLQSLSDTSVVINWRTNIPAASIVRFGSGPGQLTDSIVDLSNQIDHSILIHGLTAQTAYHYQIEDNSNVLVPGDSSLYFKTAPPFGTDTTLTFWVLGDCGTANNNQRDVRDAFYSYAGTNHTDGILFLGDNAYTDGTDAEYQFAIFENMYEDILKNTVSWSCLGNHDGHSANSSQQSGPYYDIFTFPTQGQSGGMSSGTEAYYSFDYANVHFISLDSYETDRSVGGAMYNWCLNDIQNTMADWIIAFWHHPAYSKGSHDSDTESALVQMRQNFSPMLEMNGVDLILSGHSHSYERSFFLNGHYGIASTFDTLTHTVGINGDGNGQTGSDGAYEKVSYGDDAGIGAVYITAGASGKTSSGDLDHNAMFYSVSELGSCILEIDGNEMTVKYLRENESIEDFFTILKDQPCQNDTVFISDTDGPGSLKELIDCKPSGSTIYLDASSINDTIELPSPLHIDKNLTIIGVNGQAIVQINESSPLFQIESGANVQLTNFKILSTVSNANGRVIVNAGNLTLNGMEIIESNNGVGSMILNQGVLNVNGMSEIKN